MSISFWDEPNSHVHGSNILSLFCCYAYGEAVRYCSLVSMNVCEFGSSARTSITSMAHSLVIVRRHTNA